MMTDLRELYHEMIVDHGRNPRHFGEIENPSRTKEGFNPLCGDQLTLYLNVDENKITQLKFNGCGCAISMASASLMAEAMQNKTITEASHIFEHFIAAVTQPHASFAELGKLKVLAGVSEFPARVKCATLAWHTLQSALAGSAEIVSTE